MKKLDAIKCRYELTPAHMRQSQGYIDRGKLLSILARIQALPVNTIDYVANQQTGSWVSAEALRLILEDEL